MGKRQFIYLAKDLQAHKTKLEGKEVNIILKNGKTWHARIIELKEHEIKIKDLINKKHSIPIQNLEEIIIDQSTSF